MAPQSNAAPAVILAAMSCLLLGLALPQFSVAWLTAPAGLDHTHPEILNAARRAKYISAINIMPQAYMFSALGNAALRAPDVTTAERAGVVDTLAAAAARTPGNTQVWYLLASAIETQPMTPESQQQWDHAMSMSLLTGPFARDLTLARAVQITQNWDSASPDLKNLWQEQVINEWGADPDNIYRVYTALPAAGQKILYDTLGEAPEDE